MRFAARSRSVQHQRIGNFGARLVAGDRVEQETEGREGQTIFRSGDKVAHWRWIERPRAERETALGGADEAAGRAARQRDRNDAWRQDWVRPTEVGREAKNAQENEPELYPFSGPLASAPRGLKKAEFLGIFATS